jgi:hypothetical protein
MGNLEFTNSISNYNFRNKHLISQEFFVAELKDASFKYINSEKPPHSLIEKFKINLEFSFKSRGKASAQDLKTVDE